MIFVDTNVFMYAVGPPTRCKLSARDLLHLACCRRRGIAQIKSFDRGLRAAFSSSA
ncbi:MAG: hypothetical protein ACREYE_20220 [Gammaproteobacteria bacterium]